uniref:Uncharacterized protein n=1 Tax=Arundo donax TaxID=35708 RepID=A0A0A8YNY1_ARUDO
MQINFTINKYSGQICTRKLRMLALQSKWC